MTDYEKWLDRYNKKWCTKEQLRKLVELEVLTEQEYEEITNDIYSE